MNASPKEKPLLGGAGLCRLTARGRYHALHLLQASTVWGVWKREAVRLFREFWRTANRKHLEAFFTHVAAMRGYKERLT
jgi:hypothetical protein